MLGSILAKDLKKQALDVGRLIFYIFMMYTPTTWAGMHIDGRTIHMKITKALLFSFKVAIGKKILLLSVPLQL